MKTKKVSLILSAVVMTAMLLSSCGGGASKEITIGKQVWMTENLNVDKFRNGDLIPQAKTAFEWEKAGENEEPAWCYYDNDPTNGTKYGKLYNWYAVNDARGLAPNGWHVPNDAEWTVLSDFLGGKDIAGTKMKSVSGWKENGNGTNESGFSGLPGGARNFDGSFGNIGNFGLIGNYGYWWSSSESPPYSAWFRKLDYSNGLLDRWTWYKQSGHSVRCLRD